MREIIKADIVNGTAMRQMRRSEEKKDAGWASAVFDKAPYVTVSMALLVF